jgi:hypothetical protein
MDDPVKAKRAPDFPDCPVGRRPVVESPGDSGKDLLGFLQQHQDEFGRCRIGITAFAMWF